VYSPPSKLKSTAIRYGLFQNEYSCSARTVTPIFGIEYGDKEQAVREFGKAASIPVVPESLGEQALESACNPPAPSTLPPFENVQAAISFADFAAKKGKKPR
jgi:hypothetical protein